VVLGEPGCAQEKEEGETPLGLDGEKVFSPQKQLGKKLKEPAATVVAWFLPPFPENGDG
jgi:hypothetical protein